MKGMIVSQNDAFALAHDGCEEMNVTAGTKLGPYEILSGLGTGGMGERFLFVSQKAETAPSSLAVMINWTAELKR